MPMPVQRCRDGTPSELQRVNRHISSHEWEEHRDLIRSLYLEQRYTLKAVMGIMSSQHNLHPTMMMFKKQLKKWGYDAKYIKRSDAVRISQLKLERDAAEKPSQFTLGDQHVSWDRVVNHLKRSLASETNDTASGSTPGSRDSSDRVAVRTPSPEPSSPSSPDPRRETPTELVEEGGELSQILRAYVVNSLNFRPSAMGTKPQALVPSSLQLFYWRALFHNAASFLEDGNVAKGFDSLNEALDWTAEILRNNEPNLLKIMIDVTLCNPLDCAALQHEVQHHFAELSAAVLGPAHPIAVFWKKLHVMSKSSFVHLLKIAFDSLVDTLGSLVESTPTADYRGYHSIWRDMISQESERRVSDLQSLVEAVGRPRGPSLRLLILRFRLCGALLDTGRFQEVASTLATIANMLGEMDIEVGFQDVALRFGELIPRRAVVLSVE